MNVDQKILVRQITPYTCSLACLESVYKQHGHTTTQQSLLNDYPDLCFVGRILDGRDISGALDPDEFEALCRELGLQPLRFTELVVENIEALRNLNDNQVAIFYSAKFDDNPAQRHYFRFLEIDQSDWFCFMNPTDTTLFGVIPQRLIDWQTQVFVLTLPTSSGDISGEATAATE